MKDGKQCEKDSILPSCDDTNFSCIGFFKKIDRDRIIHDRCVMQCCSIEIIIEIDDMTMIFTDISEKRNETDRRIDQKSIDVNLTEESVDVDEEQPDEHTFVPTNF